MKKEDFQGLLESVREAGQILRGEIEPSRQFWIEVPEKTEPQEGFVLCVKTDDPKLLVLSKIYRARFSSTGRIGIVDEEGESAIYPADFFIHMDLPDEVESVLENLQVEVV